MAYTRPRNAHGQISVLNLSAVRNQGPLDSSPSGLLHTELHPLQPENSTDLPPRLALIIFASGTAEGQDHFRDRALAAASAGSLTNGYLVDLDDRCDNAVFVSITTESFYQRLHSGTAEPFVATVLSEVENACMRLYGQTQIPIRLFMYGPSILAFAAGSLLPPGSKYIPYDPALTTRPSPKDVEQGQRMVAIIDGDDVGTTTERHLLASELDAAIAYSEHVTRTFNFFLDELDKIPKIELVSQGGDSALFQFEAWDAKLFESALDRLRNQTSLSISCGYGRDTKEAYLALRLAKTSGKNTTFGPTI